jgi:Na+-transporting NADH:ubiquinone oxidoreductase subunit NqrC
MNVAQDPTIIAAAIVTVVASIVTGVVTVVGAIASASERRAATDARQAILAAAVVAGAKTDQLLDKTTEIHTLTNGSNHALQKALDLMTERNAGLERLMTQLNTEKAETAAQQLRTDAERAARKAPPPGQEERRK